MSLLEAIQSGDILLLDGATGTELDKHGLMSHAAANLAHPEVVTRVHDAYLQAGSRAITTNTLTMNRIYIETHNVPVDVVEVNRAGARIARQAAGDDHFRYLSTRVTISPSRNGSTRGPKHHSFSKRDATA